MRKVVALRVFKRQFDMVKLGIGGNMHCQTRPGKVPGLVEADVMLNHRGLRPFRQLKVVAIVSSVDLVAVCSLSDVHQQQRFYRTLVTLNANMRHAPRQALGEMQEDLGLYRGAQALTVIVNGNLKPAVLDAVTQLRRN